jgi:hypothetical protein
VLPPAAAEPGSAAVFYDTRLAFDDPAAWSRAPFQALTGDSVSFAGVGSDGRYLYFVPRARLPSPSPWTSDGLVVRFDTAAGFGKPEAWQTFQTSSLHPRAKGFSHASWDGRFFYFMMGDELGSGVESRSFVVRFDTTRDFQSATSWSVFDTAPLLPKSAAAWGGGVVFDGEYIYIAARDEGIIVRFDARSPPKMPKGFSGSFY